MTRPRSRARSLLWLIALVAFVMPSFGGAPMAHATVPAERTASADCPEHAPPPDPCPAEGTARHAAGDCCPLMGATLALLPATASDFAAMPFHARVAGRVRSLAGLIFTQDPPPPRV